MTLLLLSQLENGPNDFGIVVQLTLQNARMGHAWCVPIRHLPLEICGFAEDQFLKWLLRIRVGYLT